MSPSFDLPAFDLDFEPAPNRAEIEDAEAQQLELLLLAVDEVLRLHVVYTRQTPLDLDVALDALRARRRAMVP